MLAWLERRAEDVSRLTVHGLQVNVDADEQATQGGRRGGNGSLTAYLPGLSTRRRRRRGVS